MAAKVLVIRGGAIGDFVLTLPALALFRDAFSDVELEILGYRHIISLAEGRHYAKRTRSIEYAGMARFFVPGAELPEDLVSYFAGFNHVISYLSDPDGFFESNMDRAGVGHFISGDPKVEAGFHAAFQLARPMEEFALFLESPAATLHPSLADMDFAKEFMEGMTSPVALHPGSGGTRKNWPLAKWLELIDKLIDNMGPRGLLVVGGEADGEQLGAIRQRFPQVRVAESLELPHLAAILASARLFVGHDSGISHIAAATGVRCVLLFGPTDPLVWAPANPGVKIVFAPDDILGKLGLEAVERAVLGALG